MKTLISEFRKRKGLTQEELATIVGVTRQTIISLEAGRYNPSLMLAIQIKEALGARYVEEIFVVERR